MTRVAAVDCGTNSIRLLVADVEGDRLVDVHREMRVVRLGEGVDATGELAVTALTRTFDAVTDYAATVASLRAERVRFVATSASRDARNASTFVDGVRARLGVAPEVITGDEEAALSFRGARGAAAGRPGPCLVVDIGGGSTEFVLGDGDVSAARSVDVGCVRLTERHVHHDPPTGAEVAAVVADVDAAIDTAAQAVPLSQARTLVGLAGTVTTVAALALDLPTYDPVRIHGAEIPSSAVVAVSQRLAAMGRAERAALPVMHPGRVDVIVAGSIVLRRIVERVGLPSLVASEHDILDGIAWSLA